MKTKTDAFFWAGCFALLLFGMDILVNWGDWTELLWFCPVAAVSAAVAFFRRNAMLMTICLVLAFPAQLPWVFDFILYFVGGGMGRTENLKHSGSLIFWGSAIVHTAVIPLVAWGVCKMGFHRRSMLPAMAFGAALMVASYNLTPVYKNVNCVFYSCDGDNYGLDFFVYFLVGCLLRWAVIVPSSFLLLKWVYRQHLLKEEVAHADDAQVT